MIAAPVGAVQDTTCRADGIEIASAAAGNDLSMQIMMPHIDPAAWRPLCRAMLAFLLGGWLGMSGPGLSRAALSIYLPPESLARIAPLILQGTVTRTASGFDPDTTRLATYITLEVEKVLRGPADLTQVVIREPG
ncbi:MAG: hypothetical protein ACE5ID_09890, partial [Acidobacteriota bacterium]